MERSELVKGFDQTLKTKVLTTSATFNADVLCLAVGLGQGDQLGTTVQTDDCLDEPVPFGFRLVTIHMEPGRDPFSFERIGGVDVGDAKQQTRPAPNYFDDARYSRIDQIVLISGRGLTVDTARRERRRTNSPLDRSVVVRGRRKAREIGVLGSPGIRDSSQQDLQRCTAPRWKPGLGRRRNWRALVARDCLFSTAGIRCRNQKSQPDIEPGNSNRVSMALRADLDRLGASPRQ